MGEMLAHSGHTAGAIEHQIRALTTVEEPAERAELYYRLGVLWEDGLGALEEAGVCYELALAEGLEHRDLLHRALRHLQRTGRPDQSLEVVASLLPTAEDSDELATLWLVRGEIHATREGQEEAAVEAFDMALSYDPTRQEARDGLTVVLEKQQDWAQLLQVLEATCDVGTPEQQSAALRRLARISSDELGDPDSAENYLRRSVEVAPSREALEQLEQIYSSDSGKLEQRKEVLGLLAAFGPPWFDRCLELSRLLLDEEPAWAWCLMSPLLGVSQVDQDVKGAIQGMRKEYERPPILCPSAEDLELLRHPDAAPELTAVLAELGEHLKGLGISTLDAAGDGNAIPIGETTTMGKAFGAVASAMGLEGVILHRTGTLAESTCVVNSEPTPAVVVRTDVMQQLVHAEVGFLFAFVLELARPGNRVMAALPRDNRDALVPGLWLALGFTDSAGKSATKMADRIRGATDDELRGAWAEKLSGLREKDPVELGRRWWKGTCCTARRAGLLAGADLRQVFRIQSRLEEEVERPRVVARMEELDAYVAESENLVDLVAFAASPAFGKLIRRGVATQ
jgi:tetratricopeptide (TPR) repeat protein